MARWSRLVAERFVGWLGIPPSGRWLDVGCGTGALSQAILSQAGPSSVIGLDPSPAYVEYAAGHARDERGRFEFDDYWSPYLGGQGPAPSYVASLGEGDRLALREALRARLPIRADGSIQLAARAWAVRACKPE